MSIIMQGIYIWLGCNISYVEPDIYTYRWTHSLLGNGKLTDLRKRFSIDVIFYLILNARMDTDVVRIRLDVFQRGKIPSEQLTICFRIKGQARHYRVIACLDFWKMPNVRSPGALKIDFPLHKKGRLAKRSDRRLLRGICICVVGDTRRYE